MKEEREKRNRGVFTVGRAERKRANRARQAMVCGNAGTEKGTSNREEERKGRIKRDREGGGLVKSAQGARNGRRFSTFAIA